MTVWSRLIAGLAGLYGAAGVALAALAAHRGGDTLMTAALFLLLHAGAMLAIGLADPCGSLLAGASILAAGALLFSGDLALRPDRRFPPLGVRGPDRGSTDDSRVAVGGRRRRNAEKSLF